MLSNLISAVASYLNFNMMNSKTNFVLERRKKQCILH